jgi:glucose/arabinose dehydrogenase
MRSLLKKLKILILVTTLTGIAWTDCLSGRIRLDTIRLPQGFTISLWTESVPGARSLAIGPTGTVFVGTRREGKVYAVTDRNNDKTADKVTVIASGLSSPNGVAVFNGALYIAEISRILRFDGIESNLDNPGPPVVVNDQFPSDTHHGWKYIAFGPDNRLYIPIGAPCNVCERADSRYASIMRMMPDGSGLEVFARGIRNTVGFDWHPNSQHLWFTDNGRDWLGDELPPDTLNRANKMGLHFGFPYCHAGNIPDPEFGNKFSCSKFEPPMINLGPHVAALGMKFYTGEMFPASYHGDIFIAEHGSWNRSIPIGYRITRIQLKNNRAISYEVFADGWLQKRKAWGRPVDVLVMPDGAMLVSDDRTGAIYRITFNR